MKILLIHTAYQLKGGEDSVFEQEYNLLKQNNQVKRILLNNKKGLNGLSQFIFSIWNIFVTFKIKKQIIHFKPEVVHIHNWHYACGPLAIRTIKKLNIPIILTLHNYRLLCPSATLLHNDEIFENSIHVYFPWKAIKNKVYKNSFLLTFWLSFIVWFHRIIGTWDMIDKYITLTEFAKQLFVNSNLNIPAKKIIIKPNFIDSQIISRTPKKNNFFLFIGRLSKEKGIHYLLETFKNNKLNLEIGGIGPLSEQLEVVCNNYSNIHYLGNLNKNQVLQYMKECDVLIFPSIWYEGMPMTILEALSVGTPVIASNLGAMASMIQDGYNGLLFESGNIESLTNAVSKWINFSDEEKARFSENAKKTYLELYTPSKNLSQLMSIYQSVL